MIQSDFFGGYEAQKALLKRNHLLVELDEIIEWDPLVEKVRSIWLSGNRVKKPCGAKPWDPELMLRVIFLKALYNLSFDQTEELLWDRTSFKYFAHLGPSDSVPDSRTIWKYEEELAQAGGARVLFETFKKQLKIKGWAIKEGSLVDASFVKVPKQRNNREENALIKKEETPEAWKNQPHKLAQKDVEARWALKNNQAYFGYKNHVKVGRKTKLILDYAVSSANIHDSQMLPILVTGEDISVHADSAYAGGVIKANLQQKGVENYIHEKGSRNRQLTKLQKENNRRKSKVRARVEHVFGFMQNSLGGLFQRRIGRVRNDHQIGMTNLCYNICRYAQLSTGRAKCAF